MNQTRWVVIIEIMGELVSYDKSVVICYPTETLKHEVQRKLLSLLLQKSIYVNYVFIVI